MELLGGLGTVGYLLTGENKKQYSTQKVIKPSNNNNIYTNNQYDDVHHEVNKLATNRFKQSAYPTTTGVIPSNYNNQYKKSKISIKNDNIETFDDNSIGSSDSDFSDDRKRHKKNSQRKL